MRKTSDIQKCFDILISTSVIEQSAPLYGTLFLMTPRFPQLSSELFRRFAFRIPRRTQQICRKNLQFHYKNLLVVTWVLVLTKPPIAEKELVSPYQL